MNEEGLLDGRQIPDEVMGYIRKMAVLPSESVVKVPNWLPSSLILIAG